MNWVINDFKTLLIKLFPRGRAWNIEADMVTADVLEAISVEMARVHDSAKQMLDEMDPRKTTNLLSDWEIEFGLPDECSALATTVDKRRFQLISKIITEGGQSEAYYQSLVEDGDTPLTISFGQPRTLPMTLPGPLRGLAFKHIWYVIVPDLLEEWFEADDPADSLINEIIDPAFLVCLIEKYKPAHTKVIYT